ncbi:MAG: V-type ATP synthase subunit I [Methanomassiliicoccales archaeon]
MTKILIVGANDRLRETIDLLYELENVHLVDFSSEEEEMGLGSPLEGASEVSQKLLKLRAVHRDLEIKEDEVEGTVPVDEIDKNFEEALATLELETSGVADSKSNIQHSLGDLEAQRRELEPFLKLPLDLEMYRGYDSLAVYVGHVRSDPEPQLKESVDEFEIFRSDDRHTVAVFVANEEDGEANRILVENGFSEVGIPEAEGSPSERLKAIEREEKELNDKLKEVSSRLAKLREKHATFLLAAEEHLSIQVEKAETPLRFGSTEHSFVMDAWIPTEALDKVEKGLNERIGDEAHMEIIVHQDRRGKEEALEEKQEEDPDKVPVRFSNPKTVGRFEFLISLVSRPKYNEVDPTSLVSIFFPLFFGLMVGDIGYGIPFLILGWLGLRKCTSDEWRTVATMLFYGGIFTIIFGFFLFGEALGMHFAPSEYGDITWSSLLGVHLPHQIDLGAFAIPIGVFSKLHDVKILLYISVWVGILHLMAGLAVGFVNVTMRHGLKHAVYEKLSWILILTGGVLLGLALLDVLILGGQFELMSVEVLGGIALLVIGVVLGFIGEGGQAILELPGLMSNVFSYTRLTAIGMSKAGMALAFNTISVSLIAPAGGIAIAAAFGIFAFGHLMIFILAILSAGLHSIRLQYVEFFTKFYDGGGSKFDPLRIMRKYTEA